MNYNACVLSLSIFECYIRTKTLTCLPWFASNGNYFSNNIHDFVCSYGKNNDIKVENCGRLYTDMFPLSFEINTRETLVSVVACGNRKLVQHRNEDVEGGIKVRPKNKRNALFVFQCWFC